MSDKLWHGVDGLGKGWWDVDDGQYNGQIIDVLTMIIYTLNKILPILIISSYINYTN